MKFFKTDQEKEIERLEKEQKIIQNELNILNKEPVTVIKRLLEKEGVELVSLDRSFDSIDIVIHDDGGYHYIPIQPIAVETGYFVTSYKPRADGIHISFATFAIMKERENRPDW